MTVKKLKEIIKNMDDDVIIIMSRDEDGNGYAPLSEVDTEFLWSEEDRDIGFGKLTDDLIKEGYGEEDIIKGKPALVLWF